MTTDGQEKSSVRQVGWGNDAAPVRQRTFEEPKLMILTLALALHIPAIGEPIAKMQPAIDPMA